LLVADLKPFTVILGYVSGQNFDFKSESENIDDLAAAVAYKEGPFTAMLVGLWQDAHNTAASFFPTVGALFDDPIQKNVEASPYAYTNPWFSNWVWGGWPAMGNGVIAQSNNLFDLALQLGYKLDYLSAYLNFVKNFGSAKVGIAQAGTGSYVNLVGETSNVITAKNGLSTINYTGWMIDAGVNYFCGPWTLNLGGFYTSGQKVEMVNLMVDGQQVGMFPISSVLTGSDNNGFVYPLSTSKYFSEIIGGGILDNVAPNGGYWRGYPNPTNIWTVNAGAAWQVLPQTKLSLSWWYFGTSEKVPSRYDRTTGTWSMSNDLGNEFDLYVTQNIVDKLNLDLVGAYMVTGKAYHAESDGFGAPSNAYELGARLQWTW